VTTVSSEQPGSPVTARGEGTRARIVDAAMRLFEERGYEKTTMRAVASEAGVSLGNAYYYFGSKEELVQGFYHRIQEQHALAAGPRLQGLSGFAERLLAAELAFVDVAEPYHQFAGRFFAVAADPASPLSPFSAASEAARLASQRIFAEVVDGSDLKADPRVRQELPELLWLAHLGMVLRWVHDRSEGQATTRTLIRRAVPLVDRLARLSRLRPLRPVVHEVLDLASDLRPH
jgi:AcrR family transcriptional regulator